MEKTAENLSKLKKSKSLISISREEIDENNIQGFLLSFSKELVLIHYVYDFILDGYMILRLSDITQIKTKKTDLFQTKILISDNSYSKVDFSCDFKVGNWKELFLTVQYRDGFIIVEEELEEIPLLALGAITSINDDFVSIHEFNGVGKWGKELTHCFYEDITSVQVGNNYSSKYKSYFKENNISRPKIKDKLKLKLVK